MRRLGRVLAGVALAAGSLVAVGVAPTGALTTITVTSNADTLTVCPGATCTLRQALTDAALAVDDVVIVIQPGVGTIAPASALPFFPAPGNRALTIQGNGATIQGSGPFGLINFQSTGLLTVDRLTFSGGNNSLGGGAIQSAGSVTVTNSTFSGNVGLLAGGAIAAGMSVSVTNSTFTGNSTSGLGGGAIISTGGDVSVAYSTFAGNTGGLGSAIATGQPGTIRVFGSAFVKPAGASALCIAGGAPTSFGYNYANETANSCNLTATGDSSLDTNDPRLGALASNGGPTPTQLPETGSPLLNAISNAACQTAPLATGITADQRGVARPSPSGGGCDIGAVEVVAAVVLQPRFTG